MGVGADDVSVNESGASAFAAVLRGSFADGVTLERVGAIALGDMQTREAASEFRNAAASGLDFDGNRDSVAVVLN